MYFYSVNLSYLYTFDYEFVSSHNLPHVLSVDSQAANISYELRYHLRYSMTSREYRNLFSTLWNKESYEEEVTFLLHYSTL